MNIKTDSGMVTVNKRYPYKKFLESYIATGAFSGHTTLMAAWRTARELQSILPSLCARDAGRLAGFIFKHKPCDAFLEDVTGKKYPRT